MRTLILIGMIFGVSAYAGDNVKPSKAAIKAMLKASEKYGIDAQDLVRIAYVESRYKTDAIRNNTNGTVDVGMFQVNSVHWSTTCKGIDVLTLQGNAYCAAKILAKHAKHAETDANWLGRYHSKTKALKLQYVEKLASVEIGD